MFPWSQKVTLGWEYWNKRTFLNACSYTLIYLTDIQAEKKKLRKLGYAVRLKAEVERQRQVDLCVFNVGSVYRASFKTTRATQENPVLEKRKQSNSQGMYIYMHAHTHACTKLNIHYTYCLIPSKTGRKILATQYLLIIQFQLFQHI